MSGHAVPMMPEAEMLIMRYIRREEVNALLKTFNDWKITCCSRETGNTVDLLEGVLAINTSTLPHASSSPVYLWDYPAYEVLGVSSPVNLIETNMVAFAKNKDNVKSSLTRLVDISVVRIKDTDLPEHYPFLYTLTYRFKLKSTGDTATKSSLLHTLGIATAEIKELTDSVSPKAEYRPVYWFLNGFPDELVGLRGLPEKVRLHDGRTVKVGSEGKIERGFPYASYILYNVPPTDNVIRTTDLSLLSVIAHITERGYRRKLHDLLQEVEGEVKEFDRKHSAGLTTELLTIEALRDSINELAQIQTRIYPRIVEFFKVRRRLVRSKGLVQRIRQICGSYEEGERTFFDIVCDDAITLIEDEASLSEEEIANSFKAVSDRLATLNNQLNSAYNQRSAARGQELQTIGMLLQATAIGWIAFQMADKLLPASMWNSLDLRAGVQFGISILSFGLTWLVLWIRINHRVRSSSQPTQPAK